MILDEKLIEIGVELSSAEEAIRYAASLLYEQGYVKEGYADQVVKREKEYPTGLLGQEIGIAIPHTVAEFANKPAVAIIIPKKSVKFIMMGTKDQEVNVEIIMPMVIKDPNMQLTLLKRVMKVVSNSELLKKIRDSKNKKEIMQHLIQLEIES